MEYWKTIPATSRQRLAQAPYCPKKLMLLHSGVALGVSLITTVLNLILTQQIDATGGLGGLELRSVLRTLQSVLELIGTLALPFWEVGILAAALMWANGQAAHPHILLQGFRRFGPVLRLRLLQVLMIVAVLIVLSYPATTLFLLTPWADPLVGQLDSLLSVGTSSGEITNQLMETTASAIQPLMLFVLGMCACVILPLLYRMRFAQYLLMGQNPPGALAALIQSFRMTRKNCLKLLKLDLHFWWFYGLQILAVAICYGDVLLNALGVTLPWSSTVSFFLFYCLGLACQLLLSLWARPLLLTSYAQATILLQPPVAIEES